MKSILMSSKRVFENTGGQDIFLSFHPQEGDSVAVLLTMTLPNAWRNSILLKDCRSIAMSKIKESQMGETPIIEARIKSLNRTFYLQINQDVMSGSFSKTAMRNSLDSKTGKISPEMIDEINRSTRQNQNSPASVFVNFGGSIPSLSKFFKNKLSGNFALLNNFDAIATLNMNFKSDALMLNGITETDTIKRNLHQSFFTSKSCSKPYKTYCSRQYR